MKKQYIQLEALFVSVIAEDILKVSNEEDVFVDGGGLFG